jgi:hypothetical protein
MIEKHDHGRDQRELRKQRRQAIDAFISLHSVDKLRQQTAAQLRELLRASADARLAKVSVEDIQRVVRQRASKPRGVKR